MIHPSTNLVSRTRSSHTPCGQCGCDPLARLPSRAWTDVDEIDAFLVPQLAGRKGNVTKRNLGDQLGAERIGDVESATNRLPGVRGARKLVLFMCDVEPRAFWIRPQPMRLAAMTEELPDHLAAA